MRRPGVLWEAYVTRFLDVFERFKQHRLTAEEAGELLNLSAQAGLSCGCAAQPEPVSASHVAALASGVAAAASESIRKPLF